MESAISYQDIKRGRPIKLMGKFTKDLRRAPYQADSTHLSNQ